jgi:hypothetical protein
MLMPARVPAAVRAFFQFLWSAFYVVKGGFFLRKKPLGRVGFDIEQLDNRCSRNQEAS